MPRPVRAQGRPGTRVIPADWNESHAPVGQAAARGECSLRVPGLERVWDEELEQMVQVPYEPYAVEVPCRVQALSGQARQVNVAEDDETVADYLITVPLDQQVLEGHLVIVTAGDPLLEGVVLRVEQMVRGTERFERDLFCVLAD